MKVNLIVATCIDGGIGYNNKIPWHLKKDMLYFRQKTNNSIVVMGKNTFLSILEKNKKPLQNRTNVVLSSSLDRCYECPEVKIVSNFEELLNYLENVDNKIPIWIIGGEKLYNQCILEKRLQIDYYITLVHKKFVCDTFFYFDFKQYNKLLLETYTENNVVVENYLYTLKAIKDHSTDCH